jgi:hypothetical protein
MKVRATGAVNIVMPATTMTAITPESVRYSLTV